MAFSKISLVVPVSTTLPCFMTLPSEGADGTAQSGLSLRVFNDAPEHLEQSVIALVDSLALQPPMAKCNWKTQKNLRWQKAMRGSYND